MILNSFAILDGLLTLLRLGLGGGIVFLGLLLWRNRTQPGAGEWDRQESRAYLLFQFAFLFLFLNLASWPLMYLLLQSYVPEWPGVMCVYGVTRIGTGSLGPGRFLPGLLVLLQIVKPLLVFLGGVWLTLYFANRRTSSSPLMGRLLLVLVGLGMLGVLDGMAETAYLVIPKKEDIPEAGCCTASEESEGRFQLTAFLGEGFRSWLAPAFYALNGGMVLALFWLLRKIQTGGARIGNPGPKTKITDSLGVIFLGSLISMGVSLLFLVDVAAPVWLHMPNHHCPYDLIPRVPETILGAASYITGIFSVGWAFLAAMFANCPETEATLPLQIRKILIFGLFGYAGAMVMVAMEFRLA